MREWTSLLLKQEQIMRSFYSRRTALRRDRDLFIPHVWSI